MVDSRGFGGSTGCLDFAGPDEPADVKAAIDWAAAQPRSTGGQPATRQQRRTFNAPD